MPRRSLARLLWLALVCWAAGILWLSARTPQQMPDAAFLLGDKVNHVIAYTVGGWLAASALRLSRPRSPAAGSVAMAIVVVAGIGIADEMLQALTPGRTGADIYDWTADLFGALTGALVSAATHRRLDSPSRPLIPRNSHRSGPPEPPKTR